jgi:hypothetical protein
MLGFLLISMSRIEIAASQGNQQIIRSGNCNIQIFGSGNIIYSGCGDRHDELTRIVNLIRDRGQLLYQQYQNGDRSEAVRQGLAQVQNSLGRLAVISATACEVDAVFGALKYQVFVRPAQADQQRNIQETSRLSRELYSAMSRLAGAIDIISVEVVVHDIRALVEEYNKHVVASRRTPPDGDFFQENPSIAAQQVAAINRRLLSVSAYFQCPYMIVPTTLVVGPRQPSQGGRY